MRHLQGGSGKALLDSGDVEPHRGPRREWRPPRGARRGGGGGAGAEASPGTMAAGQGANPDLDPCLGPDLNPEPDRSHTLWPALALTLHRPGRWRCAAHPGLTAPAEVRSCQTLQPDIRRCPVWRRRTGGFCRAPAVGATCSGWLKLLGVAGPWGLPGLGTRPSGARGTGLGMCGDIHLHPGPLRTAVASVTFLRPCAAEVASWGVDVIFL